MAAKSQQSGGEPVSTLAQAAWVCHDWANQPYFSLVTIFLFAPYFTHVVVGDDIAGQAVWGYVQATAGILIALTSPILGAMADAAGPRKPWIAAFTVLFIFGCFGLWFAIPGSPVFPIALALVMAAIGMEFTVTFCNSMLPTIASERRMGLLSGLGIGMGQLAAIVALVIVLICLQLPGRVHAPFIPEAPLFGLSRVTFETDRITGPIAAIWFLIFMLPLFLFVPDQKNRGISRMQAAREGLSRLALTLKKARALRNVGLYLVGRMAFYDGMTAIFVFGGILASSIFGWGALQLAVYGIVVTLFAAFGAFAGGWIDRKFGSRRTLICALIGVIVTFLILMSFDRTHVLMVFEIPVPQGAKPLTTLPEQLFIAATAMFGLTSGPVLASSRTMLARLAPLDMMTEFFGLYALAGKATTFVAPLLIGIVTTATGNQKLGLSVVVPLILIGLAVLFVVKEERATTVH